MGLSRPLTALVFAGCLLIYTGLQPALAHSPHDVIDSLAVSPDYERDRTVFIAITHHLRKSTDGGRSWKKLVNGLDAHYHFSSVVLSPDYAADATAFAATYGDGVYRSEDGGQTWHKANQGLTDASVAALALSPDYAATGIALALTTAGAVFRSTDGGRTWTEVLSAKIAVTSVAFAQTSGGTLALAGSEQGLVYLSRNAGKTWEDAPQQAGDQPLTAIGVAHDPQGEDQIYVGGADGRLFRSPIAELAFDSPLKQFDSRVVAIAPSPGYTRDATVYVSTRTDAVFVSDDAGSTWRQQGAGLTKDRQAETKKYRSPHFRHIAFSNAFARDKVMFMAGFDGLFYSSDAGQVWHQLETLPVGLVKGLAVSPAAGNGRPVLGLATYGGGGYFTPDDGQRWDIGNHGVRTTRFSDIAFSPDFAADATVFSGALGRLLKSDNGGRRWDSINHGKPHHVARFVRKVLRKVGLDAVNKKLFREHELANPYPTVVAVSPGYRDDRTVFFGTRWHGVYRSDDGGRSSRQVWDADGVAIVGLALSPAFRKDGTLFASVRNQGLFRSNDRGNTWKPANKGIDTLSRWSKEAQGNRTSRDLVVAVSPDFAADQTVFAGGSYGLYKSTDGGQSWQSLPLAGNGRTANVIALALSPQFATDSALLVSVKGVGLFASADAGRTFGETGADLRASNQQLEFIDYSSALPGVVYAASSEEAFVSADRGSTWRRLPRPVRYENSREPVRYAGSWQLEKDNIYSGQSLAHSDARGDTARLSFVGTGVRWIGTASQEGGKANVFVDGELLATVSQYEETRRTGVESWSVTGLAPGPHELMIEVTGDRHADARGTRVSVDAIDVLP